MTIAVWNKNEIAIALVVITISPLLNDVIEMDLEKLKDSYFYLSFA